MIAEFIDPNDPRWEAALARSRHDFFHLPDYLSLCSKHEGGGPVAFYAEDGGTVFLAPLLLKSLPPELGAPAAWCDASSPYGYPCPILTPGANVGALRRFLPAFREAAAGRGIVTAFLRLHPLIDLPGGPWQEFGTLVHHGQTVYIDLSLPPEGIWAQIRRDHRKDINRLRRRGFQVTFDDWSMFDEFMRNYRATMRRVSASGFYFFSNAYFHELRAALGSRLHLCLALSPSGEAAAGGLFTVMNGISQGFLAGTADRYLPMSPSTLVIHSELGWAKNAGSALYHLGGGVGACADSLFRFKAGFSKLRADFCTYRMVVDAAKYEYLVRSAQADGLDTEDASGFFPRYRQGLTNALPKTTQPLRARSAAAGQQDPEIDEP
jgi:hypothetical protein